jgi:hypothetical protein
MLQKRIELQLQVKRKKKTKHTVFLCEAAGLQERDLTLVLEILLVANEEDDDVGAGELARVRQPVGESVEALAAGDVVDEEGACSAAVVAPGDGPTGFKGVNIDRY